MSGDPTQGRDQHVVPIGDAIEHDVNGDCVCGPTPTFVDGGVVHVHHSLDGREQNDNEAQR